MEICLDCKDKVIKFYSFKRKVTEHQRHNISFTKQKTRQREQKTKIVQSIIDIVENYTEKFAISSICVEETTNKLIIESRTPPVEVRSQLLEASPVKNEPEVDLSVEEPSLIEDSEDSESMNGNHYNHGDSSEPGTSSSTVVKQSRMRIRQDVDGENSHIF